MRRTLLAVALSLAVHVVFVASVVAIAAWRGVTQAPPVRLSAIAVDVRELPLGAAHPSETKADDRGLPRPVRRPRAARLHPSHTGVAVALAPDGGISDASPQTGSGTPDARPEAGAGHRRPGDLRNYGPEGSRLTALLRLDRLRASSARSLYAAAIDQLLILLPDRRRLIEGTGLDLFRDFDALLIATPEPRNDKVTFLAVRHHLRDTALRAALDRGATATGHVIEWRPEGGRPLGVRRPAAAPGQARGLGVDDRIFVLPQPFLAVMAPPAYAEQLVGSSAGKPSQGKTEGADAGRSDGAWRAASTSPPAKKTTRIGWRELVARIDAEDSALPDDAVFMITATNLFVLPGPSPVVPGTRGAVDVDVRAQGPYGSTPQVLTLVAGIDPSPYLELVSEFASESEARAWERDFPAWKRRLLLNPVLLVAGFAPLLDRAEESREERTLFVRASTTAEELQRLLTLVTNLARSAIGRPH
jgi:hypothetical protein